MGQTVIVLIVAALVVIAIFFWRSKSEEKKIRDREKARDQVPDVLMGEDRQEPPLDPERLNAGFPSKDPPVYALLEKENENGDASASAADLKGWEKAPVDNGVQWTLEMVPQEGKVFSIGGIQSLWLELCQLNLPLQINLWAKSRRDHLYYSPKHLPIEAEHIVVAVVMANRVGQLEPVAASKVLQALEQAATHNDVDVRLSADIERVPMLAEQTVRFVRYFDTAVEFLIVPQDPENGAFTAEQIGSVAKEAGFRSAGALWEYRIDPLAREPAMVLSTVDAHTLKFTLDVPMANFGRGDLQRFFSLANHLANHLNAVWLDAKKNPVDALAAMQLEQHLKERMKTMHQHGVDAGSERAARIFARGA